MSVHNIDVCENSPSGSYGCFHCNLDIFNGIQSDSFTLMDPDESRRYNFENFIETIRTNNICFKILWEHSKFNLENNNINVLKSIFKQNFMEYTTFFQFNDNVGFILEVNSQYTFKFHTRYKTFTQQRIYIILQYKCTNIIDLFSSSLDKEKLSQQFVKDITPVLTNLHSNDYIHDDIKYDNFIFCNQIFKLIDYGEMKIEKNKSIKDNELKKIIDIPNEIFRVIEVKRSLPPPPMNKLPLIPANKTGTPQVSKYVTSSEPVMSNPYYSPGGVEITTLKDTSPDVRLDMGTLPLPPRQSWSEWWKTKFSRKGGKKYKSKKRLRKMYRNIQTSSKYKIVKKLKNNTKSKRKHYYK
jgi:serine/threonine protein kinase